MSKSLFKQKALVSWWWVLFLFTGGSSFGFSQDTSLARSGHVEVQLLAEEQSIQPGRPFWVGVRLHMDPEWHTYWKNPGDTGLATTIQWNLPNGFSTGPLQWPVPKRIETPPLVSYGYEGDMLLLTQITPPQDLQPGTQVPLHAKVTWLECQEACIPGEASLALILPVALAPPQPLAKLQPLFTLARSQWPQTDSDWKVEAWKEGKHVELHFQPAKNVSLSSPHSVYFFPYKEGILSPSAPQILQQKPGEEGFFLELTPAPSAPSIIELAGILQAQESWIDGEKGPGHWAITVPVHEKKELSSSSLPLEEEGGWLRIIFFAFLGGLLLNLMPCVLPVLSLKVLGFIEQAKGNRKQSFIHGIAYTVGVILSFLLLAGLLLSLRALGEHIGWGFQMQSPLFLVALSILFFVLGLNLFGVFEWGLFLVGVEASVSQKKGYGKSFGMGALATIAATPCTAPFMGSALGVAVTLPTSWALLIFFTLGLGMAFPYLLLSAFPALLKWVPRPGPWMVGFKQFLGFLLLGTVIFLLFPLGFQIGHLSLILFLACLLVIAVSAWIYGRWSLPSQSLSKRFLASSLAFSLFFMASASSLWVAQQGEERTLVLEKEEQELLSSPQSLHWQKWSPEKVLRLQKQGHGVFVDFTAKWCAICQTNKLVLYSKTIETAFDEAGVVTLQADWTRHDAAIARELEKFGRNGVPLYLLYSQDPNVPPQLLPEVLTSGIILDALGAAKP